MIHVKLVYRLIDLAFVIMWLHRLVSQKKDKLGMR